MKVSINLLCCPDSLLEEHMLILGILLNDLLELLVSDQSIISPNISSDVLQTGV